MGGMHGNEQLGIALVRLLKEQPILGVQTVIGNPRAVKAKKRFTESDLNRSFGGQKGTYETRRAQRLAKLAASFDVVLDFHNTLTPQNNAAFVGVGCKPTLFKLCKQFGLRNCVEATYDCINKYCLNTISIEISVNDTLDDASYWYQKVAALAEIGIAADKGDVAVFRFTRRVTWQEKEANEYKGWVPFQPLSIADQKEVGLEGTVVPIFIGSTLTEYYATLLRKERTQ
jgi:hypothetical protein